ncbi:MAG: DnaJ domain-containing protein, partial [Chloroflexota bacterium]
MKDFYKILDITADAPQEEIKEQYRFLIQAWHPDNSPIPHKKPRLKGK